MEELYSVLQAGNVRTHIRCVHFCASNLFGVLSGFFGDFIGYIFPAVLMYSGGFNLKKVY